MSDDKQTSEHEVTRIGSGDPVKAVKENLVNTETDKATDDELKRPEHDRSPLT